MTNETVARAKALLASQIPSSQAAMPIRGRTLSLAEAQRIATEASDPPRSDVPAARVGRINRDGAVEITEEQAARWLPNGRYRVHNRDGTVTTREVGESWCAEGRKLVAERKRLAGVRARLKKERAIRDYLFDDIR